MGLGTFRRSNFPGAGLPPVWVVSCPWSPTHLPAESPQTCSGNNARHAREQSRDAPYSDSQPAPPHPSASGLSRIAPHTCTKIILVVWKPDCCVIKSPGRLANHRSTCAFPTSQRRIWRAAGTGRKAGRRKGEWLWRRRGRRRPLDRPRRRSPAATDGPTTASRRAFATWCWKTQKWC